MNYYPVLFYLDLNNQIIMTEGILVAIIGGGVAITTALLSNNEFIKKLFSKKKQPMEHDIEISNFINQQLSNLLYETSSNRVWILNMTNGGVFVPTGKSYKKMNMTFELTAPGIQSVKNDFQDLPIYFFGQVIEKLIKEEYFFIDNFNGINIDPSLKNIRLNDNTKSLYCAAIKNKDGLICSILGISFEEELIRYSEEQKEKVTAYSNIISGLMMSLLAK